MSEFQPEYQEDYNFEDRMVSPETILDDHQMEVSLRPRTLDEYIGQKKAKENLDSKDLITFDMLTKTTFNHQN